MNKKIFALTALVISPLQAGITTAIKMVKDDKVVVLFGENHYSKIERTAPQLDLLTRYFASKRPGEALTLFEGESAIHARMHAAPDGDITTQLILRLKRMHHAHKNIEIRGPSMELMDLKIGLEFGFKQSLQALLITNPLLVMANPETAYKLAQEKSREAALAAFGLMGVTPAAIEKEMRGNLNGVMHRVTALGIAKQEAIMEQIKGALSINSRYLPLMANAKSLQDLITTKDGIDAISRDLKSAGCTVFELNALCEILESPTRIIYVLAGAHHTMVLFKLLEQLGFTRKETDGMENAITTHGAMITRPDGTRETMEEKELNIDVLSKYCV